LLAAIVESSHDAIVSKTLQGIITSWNAAAERLFGYTAAEAVGQPITLIIPSEKHQEEEGILARLRAGERIDHFETVRRTKDGRLLQISLVISPIRDGSGKIIGASKVARDITLQKQAEAVLKESDRRKNEFFAIVSHELRSPLAPLLSAAELIKHKVPEGELRSASEVVHRQVARMSRLIDDLLDVSRINTGKVSLRKERLDLAVAINNAIETSRPLIDKWKHHLTVRLPAEPIFLEADSGRLSQVFSNLLDNAAKYTDPGGRIWLEAGRENDVAVVRVRDTGVGIAPEKLSSVFSLFMQESQGLTRSRGGLGIGLTVVSKLVELHGGTVTVTSAGLGRGSEFTVRLPLPARQPAPQEPAIPEESDGKHSSPNPASRRRVLVADDNEDAVQSLALLLQIVGHEVETAYDGLAAVKAAETFRPHVVLLDIGMPILNGYDAARRIRAALGSDVRLIAMTGWGQEKDRQASREAGFDYHLVKPIDIQTVEQLIEQYTPLGS
jgi:PAS domain S-box-containing protein